MDCAGIIQKVVVDRMVDLVSCGDLFAVYRLVVLQTLVLLLKDNFVLKEKAIVLLEGHQRRNLRRIMRNVGVPKKDLALFRRVLSFLFLCFQRFALIF